MNIIQKADYKIGGHLATKQDARIDKRICGQSLTEYVPSIYRDDSKGVGSTGSHSTHYLMLERIFSNVTITSSDALIDIGCGKGRVLAFFLKEKCPAKLYGIEHNEEVGKIAQEWTKKYDQVQIMIGDAFTLDYNPYTILTMARPFLPKTLLAFIEHLESTLTHPVTLISWCDQQGIPVLNGRPGWSKQEGGAILRVKGFKLFPWPQAYSVWVYDPDKRK